MKNVLKEIALIAAQFLLGLGIFIIGAFAESWPLLIFGLLLIMIAIFHEWDNE